MHVAELPGSVAGDAFGETVFSPTVAVAALYKNRFTLVAYVTHI